MCNSDCHLLFTVVGLLMACLLIFGIIATALFVTNVTVVKILSPTHLNPLSNDGYQITITPLSVLMLLSLAAVKIATYFLSAVASKNSNGVKPS